MAEPALSVIIPAFNEEARLPRYLDQVISYLESRNTSYEIIVVDDGSIDSTCSIVKEMQGQTPGLQLVRLPQNRGKGAAVRAGMLAARGELRLFTDADGATPIEELERLEKAVRNGADIAVASRALRDDETRVQGTLHRKVMGTAFNMMVQALAVPGIHDTQCGFKLFTAHAAKMTFSLQVIDDFGFDVEILFLAQKQELRIEEVAVNWNDVTGTKVKVVRDSLLMFADILTIRFNELRGRYRCAAGGLSA